MNDRLDFLKQLQELFQANGWERELDTEILDPSLEDGLSCVVRVRLKENHPVAPSEIVNDYQEGIHSMEQVQQECLRALRTGRPGL